MKQLRQFVMTHRKVLAILFTICFLLLTIILAMPYVLINANKKYVYTTKDVITQKGLTTVVVLGGGVNPDDTPKPLLQNRLDATVELYATGNVAHIIVSGDNRFDYYNEPQAMKRYLLGKAIPENIIQEDFAGRSTYESCERASKIFGLSKVLLVSQQTHLPRAIYLCRSFGIDAYGYAAKDVNSVSRSQVFRELLANIKAVFNTYIVGEKTVLGEKINL